MDATIKPQFECNEARFKALDQLLEIVSTRQKYKDNILNTLKMHVEASAEVWNTFRVILSSIEEAKANALQQYKNNCDNQHLTLQNRQVLSQQLLEHKDTIEMIILDLNKLEVDQKEATHKKLQLQSLEKIMIHQLEKANDDLNAEKDKSQRCKEVLSYIQEKSSTLQKLQSQSMELSQQRLTLSQQMQEVANKKQELHKNCEDVVEDLSLMQQTVVTVDDDLKHVEGILQNLRKQVHDISVSEGNKNSSILLTETSRRLEAWKCKKEFILQQMTTIEIAMSNIQGKIAKDASIYYNLTECDQQWTKVQEIMDKFTVAINKDEGAVCQLHQQKLVIESENSTLQKQQEQLQHGKSTYCFMHATTSFDNMKIN